MTTKTRSCRDCGESLAGGTMQHGVNAERAGMYAKEKCSECGAMRPARCVWGTGDFYYVCKPCRRGWNPKTKIEKSYPAV